jgi:spore maturation protein SpmB
MVLFLVINATAVHLMPPTGTMAVRAAAGSASPSAIWVPTLIATTCAMVVGVLVVFLLRGLERYAARPLPDAPPVAAASAEPSVPEAALSVSTAAASPTRNAIAIGIGLVLFAAVAWAIAVPGERPRVDVAKEIMNQWLIPLLVAGLLLVGLRRGVAIYDAMVAGAREGLDVVVRIAPYLVVILVAVGMFRASGALDLIIGALDPFTSAIGFPAAALPMAILRPLSGSGAFAVMAEILHAHGPDSFVGMVASTLQGSTETTFYVLTVYFGSVGIREMRHVIPALLIGDLAGFAGATLACHWFFG